MPSPFPGMDPYLEDPDVWPDFHDHFVNEIAAVLNGTLPLPFYARLGQRAELGIVEEEGVRRRLVPDVVVLRTQPSAQQGNIAILQAPRDRVSESVEVRFPTDPVEHRFVEIRDPSRGHAVVTVVEIASPSNKNPGPDRRAYLAKQQDILHSNANLVEIDLLRSGDRLFPDPGLEAAFLQRQPAPDYFVLVHRAWKRKDEERICEVFPIPLTVPLPCIAVPLLEHLPEVLLDPQFVMNRAYDRGPYLRGAVDYAQLPRPPLPADKAAWAEQCLQEWRSRHTADRTTGPEKILE